MRLGLLDVGSSAARLDLIDLDRDRMPRPRWSHKSRTRLAEHTGQDGVVTRAGADRAVAAVQDCLAAAGDSLPRFVVAYGTSAVRDAANSTDLRRRIRKETGVRLGVFSTRSEAALAYHAARHWVGDDGTPLTTVDIGGGTADVATGRKSYPREVVTVPFGAVTLTREYVTSDPPGKKDMRALVDGVEASVPDAFAHLAGARLGRTVALSKVFRQLAVLTETGGSGRPLRPDRLHRHKITEWIPRLAALDHKKRAELPGISRNRARRILAGALLAESMLGVLDIDSVEVCPWGLREGLVFRFVDAYVNAEDGSRQAVRAAAEHILA